MSSLAPPDVPNMIDRIRGAARRNADSARNAVSNVNLPNVSLPSVSLPSVSTPQVDLSKIERPKLELPKVELPKVDLPKVELPKVDLPQLPSIDDAGRAISAAAATAAEKIRELVPGQKPKGPSLVRRGVMAVTVASVIGGLAAVAAFFLDPARGAARRIAVRRRLRTQVRKARQGLGVAREGMGSGFDTARVTAKKATDRATELVRIPIESARELVISRSGAANASGNGHALEALNADGSLSEASHFSDAASTSSAPTIDELAAVTAGGDYPEEEPGSLARRDEAVGE